MAPRNGCFHALDRPLWYCNLPEVGRRSQARRQIDLPQMTPCRAQSGQGSIVIDRPGSVALAQLAPGFVIDQRYVCISDWSEVQHPLQGDLPWRRPQQVGATDDIGDALVGVVQDNGEVVGAETVAPVYDEVPDFGRQVLLQRAKDTVAHCDPQRADP
jgi:hypothetical protein